MYLSPEELSAKVAEGGWRISKGELAKPFMLTKPAVVGCDVERGAYGMVTVTFILDIKDCGISIGAFGARFKLVGPPGKTPDTILVRKRNIFLNKYGLPYVIDARRESPGIVTLLVLHNPGLRAGT